MFAKNLRNVYLFSALAAVMSIFSSNIQGAAHPHEDSQKKKFFPESTTLKELVELYFEHADEKKIEAVLEFSWLRESNLRQALLEQSRFPDESLSEIFNTLLKNNKRDIGNIDLLEEYASDLKRTPEAFCVKPLKASREDKNAYKNILKALGKVAQYRSELPSGEGWGWYNRDGSEVNN